MSVSEVIKRQETRIRNKCIKRATARQQ